VIAQSYPDSSNIRAVFKAEEDAKYYVTKQQKEEEEKKVKYFLYHSYSFYVEKWDVD